MKKFGGSNIEHSSRIMNTSDGGFILSGVTSSNDGVFKGMSKGGGEDVFIMKLDHRGEFQWNMVFGGSGSDYLHDLSVTQDNGYVLTGRSSSMDGDFKGISKEGVLGVHRDGEGEVLILGDIFVVRLDSLGNVQWKKMFGGSRYDWGQSITSISNNEFVVSGWTFSDDGDFKGLKRGTTNTDIFIMKLNDVGNILWKKTYEGEGSEKYGRSTVTTDGQYLVTGRLRVKRENMDIFVMKLDSNGNLQPKGKKSKK
jgi:hypothetical protein